jgi:ubiquinone/menaquinone biosynthesis C-methylase UbiE
MAINFLFDILAPIYDRVIKPREPEEFKTLLDLPVDGWLLDVGGGTGRVSTTLAPYISKLVICDLSVPMMKEAQGKNVACLVQGSSHLLPFQTDFFDRILVVDALHHFSDQAGAVRDLLRVLKPGGKLLIEEPDITKLQVKMVAWAEKLALMKSHFHTPEEIRKMVANHGYQAKVESDEEYAIWVIVEK